MILVEGVSRLQQAQRRVIKENSPRWDSSDIPWIEETIQYLRLNEKPKIAVMLQLEVDKLKRLPPEEKQRTFRGLPISRKSLKISKKRTVVA